MRQNVFSPIRSGHFFWCADIGRIIKHGCFHCQSQAYLVAIVLSGALATLEWYGSGLTKSLALLGDMFHVTFDSLGYLIGLVALWHGKKIFDNHKHFNTTQARFETSMGIFMAISSLIILIEVYKRYQNDAPPEILETGLLFWIAFAGLVGNVIVLAMLRLIGIKHEHGECSHDRIMRGNVRHTLVDTISSALIVVNALIFSFSSNPLWHYLDIAASVFIASFLFAGAMEMMFGNKL